LGGGLTLGAAVTVKPHAAVLAVALGALVAVAAWRARQARAALTLFAGGVVVAPIAIVAWLGTVGALPAWRAIVREYRAPPYSRLGRGAGWSVYRPAAWIPLGAGVTLTLVSALAGQRLRARHAAVALGVLYGLAHFAGQGKGWEYHLYPLAAFAIVLLFAEVE